MTSEKTNELLNNIVRVENEKFVEFKKDTTLHPLTISVTFPEGFFEGDVGSQILDCKVDIEVDETFSTIFTEETVDTVIEQIRCKLVKYEFENTVEWKNPFGQDIYLGNLVQDAVQEINFVAMDHMKRAAKEHKDLCPHEIAALKEYTTTKRY
jgi:hypothetical protein